jgi:hypothetical protein
MIAVVSNQLDWRGIAMVFREGCFGEVVFRALRSRIWSLGSAMRTAHIE